MGEPAARKGDAHFCPAHAGGEIIEGHATVLIGGQAAARLLDTAACGGGPVDAIAEGSSTVFIGGMPAARMGAATAHGGRVTGGLSSVLIGGATAGIAVAGDGAFRLRLRDELRELLRTPAGRAWLREMAATGRRVTLEPTKEATSCAPDGEGDPRSGEPPGSRIRWNPDEIGPEGAGSPARRKLAGALSEALAQARGEREAPAPVVEEDWSEH